MNPERRSSKEGSGVRLESVVIFYVVDTSIHSPRRTGVPVSRRAFRVRSLLCVRPWTSQGQGYTVLPLTGKLKDSHLLEVRRSVVLNPVRANRMDTPEAWTWSSYRATAGREAAHACLVVGRVLGQFSGKRAAAEKEYRQCVRQGIGRSVWHGVRGQAIWARTTDPDRPFSSKQSICPVFYD